MWPFKRKPPKAAPVALPPILARWDSASPKWRSLFPFEDNYSARSAGDPATRRLLRQRCRSVVDNDPNTEGIVASFASDLVGAGPSLHLLSDNADANALIAKRWDDWCNAVCLDDKLRMTVRGLATDGEIFAFFSENPLLDNGDNQVALDLVMIEADQVATPTVIPVDPQHVDGIEFDSYGNPEFYHVLKQHPGDTFQIGNLEYDREPAENAIHVFKQQRPGQARGIPTLAPSLMRIGYLGRYDLATLEAAETAANIAGLLMPPASAAEDETEQVVPFEKIPISRGTMVTTPPGATLGQFKPEQPTATYTEYHRQLIAQIARPFCMPVNVATFQTDSAFSSARLDNTYYWKTLVNEQAFLSRVMLERIFAKWLREALLIPGYLPAGTTNRLPHQWIWVRSDLWAADPQTEATAAKMRIETGLSTYAEEFGRRGLDWQSQRVQRAKEIAFDEGLGLGAVEKPSTDPQQQQDNKPNA